jgi:hypothetical protein
MRKFSSIWLYDICGRNGLVPMVVKLLWHIAFLLGIELATNDIKSFGFCIVHGKYI